MMPREPVSLSLVCRVIVKNTKVKLKSLPYYNEGCLVRDLRGRARYNRARYNRSIGGKLKFFVFFVLKTVLN